MAAELRSEVGDEKLIIQLLESSENIDTNNLETYLIALDKWFITETISPTALNFIIKISQHEAIRSTCLSRLWSLSSREKYKSILVSEGIVPVVISNIEKRICVRESLAILQNISECRFKSGAYNIFHTKIANLVVKKLSLFYVTTLNLFEKYLCCMIFGNLCVTKQNRKLILSHNGLAFMKEFILKYADAYVHEFHGISWTTLQPHITLLESPYPELQLFAVYNISLLTLKDHSKLIFFRDVTLNSGIKHIYHLAESSSCIKTTQYAKKILQNLDLPGNRVTNKTKIIEKSTFYSDFDQLFTNPNNFCVPDVSFIVGNEEIHCHKCILCCRSDFFHAMLNNERWGQKGNQYRLDGIETAVFQKVIHYIYSDNITFTDCDVVDILEASDRFGLIRLKSICEEALTEEICDENILELLCIADRYDATKLWSNCVSHFFNMTTLIEQEEYEKIPEHVKSKLYSMEI